MSETWLLESRRPKWFLETEEHPKADVVDALQPVRIRSTAEGGKTMYGRVASFGEWIEIRSPVEGNFMESMSSTAFEKTIAENGKSIRCIWHRGRDPARGFLVLGPIRSLRTDTSFEVELFDEDYSRALIPGLEAGQYGVSFSFSVAKDEVETRPRCTTWNPKGIPQVTVTEARVSEFGPTPFPAYKGASAAVRNSFEVVNERGAAHILGPPERWVKRSKPGCPGVIQRERVFEHQRASWKTDEAPSWWLSDEPFTPLEMTSEKDWVLR